MCGIAGYIGSVVNSKKEGETVLSQMAQLLEHRGPDDCGVWLDENIGLSHSRLSILDLSKNGHQPMQRGSLTISYNGEIYNFSELREELKTLGEKFYTNTDTEVLLIALMHWGDAAIHKFNGMFAFAMWNSETQVLTLARDRIGQKPIYFAKNDGNLLFASEPKAFLAVDAFKRQPNLMAIHHYLSMQYVPSPYAAFKGVEVLPPGTIMKVQPSGEYTQEKYWSLPSPTLAQPISIPEAQEKLITYLSQSVKRRMVADVPVGAFLSGGVDSSAVVSFMAEQSSSLVKTFCIGFEEDDFDEREYARYVSDLYGTDHYEEVLKPDLTKILPELIWHYGDPFADPSAIPTYYLSKLTRRHVKVALSGDAGDEFFLGYQRYESINSNEWIERIPHIFRYIFDDLAKAIPPNLASKRPFGGIRRRLKMGAMSKVDRYEPAMMYFYNSDKEEGYGHNLKSYLTNNTLDLISPYFAATPDMMSGAAYADIHSYLPDDLLVKVDRASMAFGLEVRAPFLDIDLMNFAASLPKSVKLKGGMKGLLRDSMRSRLPSKILDRNKMGFGVPIERWLSNELHDFTLDHLNSRKSMERGLFKPGYAERLMKDHTQGVRLNHTKIWAMLMLELWYQAWIDPVHVIPPQKNKSFSN